MSTFWLSMSASSIFTLLETEQSAHVTRDAEIRQGRICPATNSPTDRGVMISRQKPAALSAPTTASEPIFGNSGEKNDGEYIDGASLATDTSTSAIDDRLKPNGFRRSLSWVASRSPSRKPRYIETDSHKSQEDVTSLRSPTEASKISSIASAVYMSKPGQPENERFGQTKVAIEPDQSSLSKATMNRNSRLDESVISAPSSKPSVLQRSFSTDILPLFSGFERDLDKALRKTRVSSLHRMVQMAPDNNRRKDDLWGIFRNLEGAYLKFESKSTASKANIVRDALLPFLQKYNSHSSSLYIRPEDLDRRANILDRWWAGLLELIQGTLSSSMSGTDRLVILEAIVGLMERSEWRLHPSEFSPLFGRPLPTQHQRRRSTSTNSSTDSDFLRESVIHNTRNIFVRNIISQVAFSVEKMSLRTVPASVVAFSGKTLAYAFFLCPGIAKILIYLWKIPKTVISRVLQSYRTGGSHEDKSHEAVLAKFPSFLHDLGSKSTIWAGRHMPKPTVPIEISHISWFGSWTERWSGRESDLFYVFAKYYHILLAEFLSTKNSRSERLCAPGVLFIQSQILVNLDATLHRQANSQSSSLSSRPYTSFDEVLAETDVNVSALSFLPPNSVRQIAENRLILLIREFLSEDKPESALSRLCFAEVFGDVLRAAASQVSAYDQSACSVLCDFLEEAFLILSRFEKSTALNRQIIDWPFWHRACKRMLQSHNIATETRLYSFLYTIWGLISRDQRLKADFCFNFLLDPDFFMGKFSHWCPMVRAYYMRLLCWRITRLGQEEDYDVHRQILITTLSRLQMVWNYFLNEVSSSKANRLHSTAPCNPAPGRRIIIIRTDNHIPSNNAFLTLDGFPRGSSIPQAAPYKRSSSRTQLALVDSRSNISSDEAMHGRHTSESENGNSKWNLLRNVLAPTRSRSKSPKLPVSDHDSGSSPALSRDNSPNSSSENVPLHHNMSFKFSLEWVDRKAPAAGNIRLYSPKLPSHAQTFLDNINESHEVIKPGTVMFAKEFAQYTGRALAEWSILVNECQVFFQRRKHEGVPGDEWVETPTLGVESLRKSS